MTAFDQIQGADGLAEILENAFSTVEGLTGESKQEFLSHCSSMLPIITLMIHHGLWAQYDFLAKFHSDIRLNDLARGGINALDVLLRFFREKDAEYRELINDNKPPTDPNNPLPEPITTDGI